MHLDDRLATVLRIRTTGAVVARVQFRQLVDLLGTHPAESRTPQVDAAYVRLAQLGESIPASERARIVADPGLRLRAPRLVAWLAESDREVAAAAMEKAQLRPDEWLDLIPALSVRARGLARLRRGLGLEADALLDRLGIHERGLPPAESAESSRGEMHDGADEPTASPPAYLAESAAPDSASPQDTPRVDGIGAIVRRIEDYRRQRALAHEKAALSAATNDAITSAPRPPLRSFDFTTDAEGRIVWTDAAAAPMAVGQHLSGNWDERSIVIESAIRRRQPVRAARTTLDGAPAIAGAWHVDAVPVFEGPNSRFTGYRGRFRRPASSDDTTSPSAAESEADRMRQLLHELRTPINAIQGFAEIIQQELFGPAPHEYRALASSIVADSARILGGFDELDRLARLGTGAVEIEPGQADLAAILMHTVAQLDAYTTPRGSGFDLALAPAPCRIAVAEAEADRMVWRLLATLAATMAPGERLPLGLVADAGSVHLDLVLPQALAMRSDDELFHAVAPQQQAISAGMFGTGFALRLAAAEVRGARGTFTRNGASLRIALPSLTEFTPDTAQDAGADSKGGTAFSA